MTYTIFSSEKLGQFFFSTDHCQRLNSGRALDPSFVAISGRLPMYVAARPSLPTGLVDTIEKMIMIFHPNETEIPNPDPLFQP